MLYGWWVLNPRGEGISSAYLIVGTRFSFSSHGRALTTFLPSSSPLFQMSLTICFVQVVPTVKQILTLKKRKCYHTKPCTSLGESIGSSFLNVIVSVHLFLISYMPELRYNNSLAYVYIITERLGIARYIAVSQVSFIYVE